MATTVQQRAPGQFAQDRFRQRNRAWLKRVWWILPPAGLLVGAAPVLVALLAAPDQLTLFIGVGLGAGGTFVMAMAMSPPAHIERWREGAEGERRTAKALKPLLNAGWVVVHDIQTGKANRDHVLVGAPGVFVLETKNLGGLASVADDKLKVRWRDARDGGCYVLDGVGNQVRGQAAAVHAELRAAGVRSGWVQAVVVLWSDFEQHVVEAPKTLWVHGSKLVGNLAARDTHLDDLEIAIIAEVLRRLGER